MLKIKDNVDLKELEKFGFEKIDRTAYVNYSFIKMEAVSVSTKTRIITYDKGKYAKEVINNLIKAGLVVKIDDKWIFYTN